MTYTLLCGGTGLDPFQLRPQERSKTGEIDPLTVDDDRHRQPTTIGRYGSDHVWWTTKSAVATQRTDPTRATEPFIDTGEHTGPHRRAQQKL